MEPARILPEHIWLLLGQLALLIIAAISALLFLELWLFGAFILVETFPKRPILASGIVLLICAFLLLCIRGAGMISRTSVYFASRAVLLLVSAIICGVSMEPLYGGLLSLVAAPSLEGYLALASGMLLVAIAALGIKYAFSWRASYWIIFVATLAAVILSSFGIVIWSVT